MSNFRKCKEQLLIVFLATFEQLFEKLRDTFWKISSNLWKALPHETKALVSASFTGLPKAKWGLGNTRARETSEKHERGMMGTSILFLLFQSLPSSPLSRERVPATSFPGFSPTQPRPQGFSLKKRKREKPWGRGCSPTHPTEREKGG